MNIFNSIPLLKPKRNTFNLGAENRLTTDLFRLTPFMIREALPDDVFRLRAECFARVFPALNAPLFQRYDVRYYYFFVPTRIIWDDFEKWINPKSGTSGIVHPRIHVNANWIHNAAVASLGPKTLADYLGVNFGLAPEDQTDPTAFYDGMQKAFPPTNLNGFEISSLPFRAYQQIYNDWFIDLNNGEKAEFSKGSGVEELSTADIPAGGSIYDNPLYAALMQIRNRAWMHDYFTTAMPDAQRGEDVMAFDGQFDIPETPVKELSLPRQTVEIQGVDISSVVGSEAIVTSIDALADRYADFGFATRDSFITNNGLVQGATGLQFGVDGPIPTSVPLESRAASGDIKAGVMMGTTGSATDKDFRLRLTVNDPNTGLQVIYLPLQVATKATSYQSELPFFTIPGQRAVSAGVTVEELRTRMQMQSFIERNNVGGPRYTEMLYAHWGVVDPDGRLQRSEFLGGGRTPVMVNEVTQNSAPTDEDPLGQYAGQGTVNGVSRTIKFRAPEHGFVIGLMCITPKAGYMQGLHRMWKRFDRLDMYWPSFAHLGEQELKNHEVLFSSFDPDGTFGYQQRYAEYKTALDEVHGDMKGNLAFWHGARAFDTPGNEDEIPKLSQEFTTPSGPGQDGSDRVFPVLSEDVSWRNDDHFVVDMYCHCIASRRMPKYVTPRNGS